MGYYDKHGKISPTIAARILNRKGASPHNQGSPSVQNLVNYPFRKASRASLLILKAVPIFLAFKSPALIAASTSSSVTFKICAASAGVITEGMAAPAPAAAAPPAAC